MAYLSYADPADAPRNGHLGLVPTAGGMLRCLTMSFDRHLEITDPEAPIRWNIDARTILRRER
jgi:hypothetical protein